MYYFGTNLDERFSVPDFWPKPEQTYKIPYEREEISKELDRLQQQRLYKREMRLINEGYSEEEIRAAMATQKPLSGSTSRTGGPLDNEAKRAVEWMRSSFGFGSR